ncbi:MAG TPA: FtsQ-type POTRA domain-containing protein [Gemmatimonadaceae bacterium]
MTKEPTPDAVPKDGRRPSVRLSLIAIAIVLVVGAPLWGPLLLRRLTFFHVHRVEILGARYVAPRDILSRLHVDTMASVWDPTGPLAVRVAGHPAIQHAEVRRKLPGTLVIEIVERVPIALVQAAGGFRVYDARGVALPIDPARVLVDLPVLMERDTTALRLLGAMHAARPDLYDRVSAVRRAGRDELILQLKTEPVRVMQDVTLDRLADIEPVEADLGRKQLHVAEIDLRYRDQVIARLQ